jgi:RNA polymerase sigma-70 factor (ECF subfamily)
MTDEARLAARLEEHRSRLRRLARRMLGSDVEADDAVQEVWLRLSRTGDDEIENLGGWLTTATARVSLNMLRTRATRHETGYDDLPPYPSVTPDGPADPAATAQLSDAVEAALLLVLDRLTPSERVAFVLHDSFEIPFERIGELLDRSPEAARQLASRARRRAREATDDDADEDRRRGRRLVDAFFAAAREGDFDALVSLLAPDVLMRADGVASATTIIRGATQVAGRALMFANPAALMHPVRVDGHPGVVVIVEGAPLSLMAFRVHGNRIQEIDSYAGLALGRIPLPMLPSP